MLENIVKARMYYAVLALAIRSDLVVGQMTKHCSEDNTGVDFVELGDGFGVGVEDEHIGEADRLGLIAILRQPWQHHPFSSDPANFLYHSGLPVWLIL